MYEHKAKMIPGFTEKYNVNKLVLFEETNDVSAAIAREKEIKKWRRERRTIWWSLSILIGRMTAALLVTAGASVAAGAGTALGLIAVGMPAAGSLLMGSSCACLGITFAAVAGLTAQLVVSARTAAGMAGAVLGASYLLRAIGDASAGSGSSWLSWPSPVGWWQQTRPVRRRPMVGPRAPAGPLGGGRRAGVRARGAPGFRRRPPPGPARARQRGGPVAQSGVALAWRLQRGGFFAWAAALVVIGVAIGGMASSVGDFLKSPQAQDFLTRLGGVKDLRDAFLAVELGFAGVFGAVFGVQAAMRLRSEESALRVDPLLATGVRRTAWMWSHLAIALFGAAVLLVLVGVSAGLAGALQTGDSGQFGRLVAAALVQIPAVWVVIGIVVAAFGLVPRLIVVGWAALIGFVLLGEFGPLFHLSRAVMDVSPFAHVPRLPGRWVCLGAAALADGRHRRPRRRRTRRVPAARRGLSGARQPRPRAAARHPLGEPCPPGLQRLARPVRTDRRLARRDQLVAGVRAVAVDYLGFASFPHLRRPLGIRPQHSCQSDEVRFAFGDDPLGQRARSRCGRRRSRERSPRASRPPPGAPCSPASCSASATWGRPKDSYVPPITER